MAIERDMADNEFAAKVKDLASPDAATRLDAVGFLGWSDSKEALPYLFDMLEDPDERIRGCALGGIIETGFASMVPRLLSLLSHPSAFVRLAGLQCLSVARSDGPAARTCAFPAVALLLDEDPQVRYLAACFLKGLPSGMLLNLAERQSTGSDNWEEQLRQGDRLQRLQALLLLADHVRPHQGPLAQAAFDPADELRLAWLVALARHGRPPFDVLIPLLSDAAVTVRQFATFLAGESGDGRAVPSLEHALMDTESGVREAAAEALGKIEAIPDTAIRKLVSALIDPWAPVRSHACLSLKKVGPPAAAALPALLGTLRDGHDGVSFHAALAIVSLRPRSLAVLLEMIGALADSRPPSTKHVGQAIIYLLPLVDDLSAVRVAALELADHPVNDVRAAAKDILRCLDHADGCEAIVLANIFNIAFGPAASH